MKLFQGLKSQNKVAVAYNLRFMPAAKVVREIIRSGKLGKITTVFSEVGQYLPDWRPKCDYRKGVSARKKLGGGSLLELSHELDYLNWFFGPFAQVCSVMRSSQLLDIDVEDTVDAILENKSGIIFHLHLDFLQRNASRSCRAVGENGTLIWNLMSNEVIIQESSLKSHVLFSDSGYDRNEMYVEQLRAFVDFVESKGSFDSTLDSSIEVMRLVEAIRLSEKKRAWVRLEE